MKYSDVWSFSYCVRVVQRHNIQISAFVLGLRELCWRWVAVHNLSLHLYKGIMGKNEAWKEVAEIIGVSGECANS